jgi:UDP-2-acetamido-2-deoxy-ribo-hexuluronate aminotransferase
MIKFTNLIQQDLPVLKKIKKRIIQVIKNDNYILGENVKIFEKNFKKICNSKFAVSCSSGTDALFLTLKSLNLKKNSEVLVPAFTYCSSAFSVINAGYSLKLVDVNSNNALIDYDELIKKITKKTKAVIIVNLFGNTNIPKKVIQILKKKKIFLIEDSAQAHLSFNCIDCKNFKNKTCCKKGNVSGSIGDFGCFSFYPTKNLGAYGDGGIILTKHKNYYSKLLKLRNLGSHIKYQHDIIGFNSRLDTIQAAILDEKLKYLELNNKKKNKISMIYKNKIKNKFVKHLEYTKGAAIHQYTLLCSRRDKLINSLIKNKIEFNIHYPYAINQLVPIKKILGKTKFKNAEYLSKSIISLPLNPNLKNKEINKICNVVNSL